MPSYNKVAFFVDLNVFTKSRRIGFYGVDITSFKNNF